MQDQGNIPDRLGSCAKPWFEIYAEEHQRHRECAEHTRHNRITHVFLELLKVSNDTDTIMIFQMAKGEVWKKILILAADAPCCPLLLLL